MSLSTVAILALAALGEARTVIQKKEISRPKFGNIPYGADIISCNQPGVIALTFDDGPGPLTAGIVDTLEKAGAKGTFFMVGKNGEDGLVTGDYTALVKRIHKAGHHIGSHSFTHPNFNEISYDEKVEELLQNEQAFVKTLGVIPTYFRPPYTACNGECYQALGDMGYHVTDYDLDTKDWENGGANAKEKYGNAVRFSNPDFNSFISLSHDIQPFTADGFVQFMLDVGHEKGYRFVTLGECLGDPAGNWYRDPETGDAIGDAPPEPTPEPTTSTSSKAPPPPKTTSTQAAPQASPGAHKEEESSAVSSAEESAATTAAAATGTIRTILTITTTSSASAESSALSTSPATTAATAATSSTDDSAAASTSSAEEETEPSAASFRAPSLTNALIASLAGLAAWAFL
ncbi:chitin deacetylase [Plectosphaerella plurivora]|uniref:Chitin deacetylase n=1 Tax=Plectosphaerella plurivora TaxID=936078 RepID=A0A9P8V5I8_9PEZI|nr:chitin deacetylase [Plectosphaerella plurivora]